MNDNARSIQNLLRAFVLVRLLGKAKSPPSRAQLLNDLKPYFASRANAPEWGESLDEALQRLQTEELIAAKPFRLTEGGRQRAAHFLGVEDPPNVNWPTLRDRYLIALALDIAPSDKAALQAVGTSKGFRPAVLVRHYQLPGAKVPSESRVLHVLAWKQLQSAHDIEIPTTEDFKPNPVLKATLLKGQKGDPITLLAGQVTKAQSNQLKHVREAVIWNWLEKQSAPLPEFSNSQPASDSNLSDFAGQVRELARTSPTGKFGENKVFLSHVWRRFQTAGSNGMSRDEFNHRLVEANRENLLTLSRADLIGAMNPEDVAESEIRLSNATFHFIRTDR